MKAKTLGQLYNEGSWKDKELIYAILNCINRLERRLVYIETVEEVEHGVGFKRGLERAIAQGGNDADIMSILEEVYTSMKPVIGRDADVFFSKGKSKKKKKGRSKEEKRAKKFRREARETQEESEERLAEAEEVIDQLNEQIDGLQEEITDLQNRLEEVEGTAQEIEAQEERISSLEEENVSSS